MTLSESPPTGLPVSETASVNESKAATATEPQDNIQPSKLKRHWKLFLIVSVLALLVIICAILLAVFSKHLTPSDKTVDLEYAQYRGTVQPNSEVKAWMGIRYAAPPVGDLRFAAPQDPVAVDGIQDALKHGSTCLSVGDKPPVARTSSEDCLFLDVYAPSGATADSKLPVFFFIQGGGFAGNANANYNGRGLIEAAAMDMVVVTFNYRVGVYGFIAGDDIESPNNGLKDQRKALSWVKRHIAKFGGNPDHVVLGGDSAGAASIALHMSAYGGRDTDLFHAAAMESPSFATMLTNNQSRFLYEAFVGTTSCEGASNTLACLRGLSVDELQPSNQRYPYPNATGPPVFSWNPVIDGDMIQDFAYSAFNNGKFVKIPTIVGDDSNAGTIFAPRNTNSLEQSNQFLKNTFPYLNDNHIEKLNELYPNNPQDVFPGSGSYWRRTANVYGDMRYMCPSIFIATAVKTHASTSKALAWSYRFNVEDPRQISMGLGVPHTTELAAIWGPENIDNDPVPESYRKGRTNADIVPLMQGYWTSFIRFWDPNRDREEDAPEWKSWDGELEPEARKFSSKDSPIERISFNSPISNTSMESIGADLQERCEYLWSIALDLRQ